VQLLPRAVADPVLQLDTIPGLAEPDQVIVLAQRNLSVLPVVVRGPEELSSAYDFGPAPKHKA
jgi:hypothetical protein